MRKYFWPEALRISEDIAFEGHGAAILLLVREKRAKNWADLCRIFQFDPRGNHSGHHALRRTLRELIASGLLESKVGFVGPYRVSPRVEEIQEALDLSLVEAANLTLNEGMAVRPLFGGRPQPFGSAHVFVLMPFADSFTPVYDAIRAAGRQLRLSVERADDFFSTNAVMDDVWTGICNSGVVVADCTGKNPNVFYEIGVAHTVGRDVILLAQTTADIPFDIGHLRHIQYALTAPGLRQLRDAVRKTIASVRDEGWTA